MPNENGQREFPLPMAAGDASDYDPRSFHYSTDGIYLSIISEGNIMNTKFELTDQTRQVFGVTVYRIRALKDIRPPSKDGDGIPAGSLGGYVESEANLSAVGRCWIGMGAVATGKSLVTGNSTLTGHAILADNARIEGYAIVSGNLNNPSHRDGGLLVGDNATVSDRARVYDSAMILGNSIIAGNAYLRDCVVVNGQSVVSDGVVLTDGVHIRHSLLSGNVRMAGGSAYCNVEKHHNADKFKSRSPLVNDEEAYATGHKFNFYARTLIDYYLRHGMLSTDDFIGPNFELHLPYGFMPEFKDGRDFS